MDDLDRPITYRDLRNELEAVLTTLATKEDLKAFATKEDLKAFATKEDLKAYPTREEMSARFDELRRHFDVVTEAIRSDLRNFYDWAFGTTDSLGKRVAHLETNHGSRLIALETRVTRLEKRRK